MSAAAQILPAVTQTFRNIILADSPYAFWQFNEASGTSFADLGSGNNALTSTGTVNAGQTSLWGNTRRAITTDGSTGYLAPASSTGFPHTGSFTWMFIVSFTALPADGISQQMAVCGITGETEVTNVTTQIGLLNTGGVYSITSFHENGAGVNNTSSVTVTPSTGVRYMYHVVRDVAANTYTVYQNGSSVGSAGYTNDPTGGGNGILNLCRNSVTAGSYFNGKMDEVAFFKTNLSAARIAAHYAALR